MNFIARTTRPTAADSQASLPRITVVLGTRPEAVKLAPVLRALVGIAQVRLVLTGQHGDMVENLLNDLGLCPDIRLGVMSPRQTLGGLTARLMDSLADELTAYRPDAVVVQGDTTTAMCGALAAFYDAIPVAHVEAGLRTFDRANPFPEETNRRLIAQMATWHFAPTLRAAGNLLEEGQRVDTVYMTGNTVIDSLLWVRHHSLGTSAFATDRRPRLLVTLHRRETQGSEMLALCVGIGQVAEELDLNVVLPMHSNPAVRESVMPALAGNPNVKLVEPLGYLDFIATLADATAVVTDSGGVQEEAPSLGVPVLVARATTERPEAVQAGCARLVGTDPSAMVAAIRDVVTNRHTHATMARPVSPFGDGLAAHRIADTLIADLAAEKRRKSPSCV